MTTGFSTPPGVSQRWLLLAASSLGLSAVAAAALVLARTPVLTSLVPPDSFPRALVVHVNLATLLWYFTMAGAMWTEALPSSRHRTAQALLVAGAVGAIGVVTSGLFAPGNPVLANYFPYLDHPIFLGSLAVFVSAGLCTGGISLVRPRDAAEWGFAIARWPFCTGAIYLALALRQGMGLVDALWGAGHILQFGFVTLMMAMWLRLSERTGMTDVPPRIAIPFFVAASLPATIAPALLLAGLDQGTLHSLHTDIMRWTNWPAALAFGLLLLSRKEARSADSFTASLGLYCIGILAGTAIDSQTTMVPAHYHGTIGAFTLAQMAAVLARISPAADADHSPPSTRPLSVYTFGITTLICGLAWSGILGAPRKVAFSGEGADPAAILAAALTGTGGAITIAGVGYFACIAVPRILRLCRTHTAPTSRYSAPATAAMFAAAR
ncbi:hypothetical protein SAMN05421829_11262 [Aromatoleum tolulyticum]|uniref:Heme/copper-type cytochrome/quinol oxidase, subunit 1 n=1 Tax=Aromatoleum tolulyticum TaxID=34027 RepID=A0A1N6ZLN4_9RHOO|nr:hypothetical protein [Aromatoleum tolulyticum]SIR27790.1 hypothetical protein SAMN05421829_11262 [Aromatoleum tolulyticum]